MSQFSMIYVTCPSKEEAEKILFDLLEKRLVACGNISSPITSYYHWQGEIENSEEFVLILKSKSGLFSEIEQRIAEIHSYEVPCIVEINLEKLHQPYANWVNEETK